MAITIITMTNGSENICLVIMVGHWSVYFNYGYIIIHNAYMQSLNPVHEWDLNHKIVKKLYIIFYNCLLVLQNGLGNFHGYPFHCDVLGGARLTGSVGVRWGGWHENRYLFSILWRVSPVYLLKLVI